MDTKPPQSAKPAEPQRQKKKFDGDCRHCNIYGHKCADCRKPLREEAACGKQDNPHTKTKHNPKLVCQICGKLGYSARDGRFRIPGQSAYRNVPYSKQTTTEDKDFIRDFKRAQNPPRNSMRRTLKNLQSSEEELNERYDQGDDRNDVGHSKNL